MRTSRAIRSTTTASALAVIHVVGLGGCVGSGSSSSARPVQRHDALVGAPPCAPDEVVERDLQRNGSRYQCVTPNPAQPASTNADVQQGDRCDDFGATVANKQGLVFDCEPWGVDRHMRWVRP